MLSFPRWAQRVDGRRRRSLGGTATMNSRSVTRKPISDLTARGKQLLIWLGPKEYSNLTKNILTRTR